MKVLSVNGKNSVYFNSPSNESYIFFVIILKSFIVLNSLLPSMSGFAVNTTKFNGE